MFCQGNLNLHRHTPHATPVPVTDLSRTGNVAGDAGGASFAFVKMLTFIPTFIPTVPIYVH